MNLMSQIHTDGAFSAQRPIAFVTGAAQGIGLASVERLARDGFQVVAMDRNGERLQAAVADLRTGKACRCTAPRWTYAIALRWSPRWTRSPVSTPWSALRASTTTPHCST